MNGTLEFSGLLTNVEAALASGITYAPTSGFIGTDTLSFSASDGAFASNTAALNINVDAVAPTVSISPASVSVNEDGTVALPITVTPVNSHDDVTVTIGGISAGDTLNYGAGDTWAGGGGPVTMSLAQFDDGVTLTVGSQISTLDLTIQATNNSGMGASAPEQTLPVTVAPVAPTLNITDNTLSVTEGGAVALGISETPFDPNDIVSITISNVPTDATLSAGTDDGGGNWTLTSSELSELMFDAGDTSAPDLTVTATNTGGSGASATPQAIDVTVTPPPTADNWTGGANDGEWSTAGNWNNGVPGANSEANITVTTGTTVTLNSSDTVYSLTTNSDTMLDITGGTLTISSTLQIDSGATLTLSNANIFGGSVTNAGSIDATGAGTDKILGNSIDNEGTITAENGAILNLASQVTGGGSIVIDTAATVIIGAYNTKSVNFAAATGTLQINGSANFTGTVSNFASGGTIDLAGITYSPTETDIWNSGNNTLTISNGTQSAILNLAGTYTQSEFALQQDSGTDTDIVIAAAGVAAAISTSTIVLAATDSFGGSGEHQGAAVTYADGALYLSYNNGPENQNTTDTADIVAFNTAPNGATQTFTYAWNDGDLFGIAADGSQIYAAGESTPYDGLTTDDVGGVEAKSIFVRFDDDDGTAGSGPSPAAGYTASNFFSYEGVEGFQNVIATTQSGNTVLYAVGSGQPASYSGYIIAEYSSTGTLLASATDSLASYSNPGGSSANDAVDWNGAIWVVGSEDHPNLGDTYGHATVWTASYNLSSIVAYEDNTGGDSAAFNSVATIGNELYAAGYANVASGQDYLLAEYNTNGSVAWSETFASGTDTTNVLTGAVAVDGRLFAVGYTVSGSATEGVLMEINPSNGSVISTTTYDAASYNSFTSITTDGQYLYVGGVSGSSSTSDQAVLLTYDIGGTSTATVEDTAVALHSISVSDAAVAGTAQIEVTLAAGDGALALENDSGLDSVTGNGSDSVNLFGTQSAIDTVLADGVVYDPTAGYVGNDTVTVTANDEAHGASSTALSTTGDIDISITAADSIAAGTVDTVSTSSSDTYLFVGSTGTLDLASPSTFTGEIAGITGTGDNATSDVIDLNGFNWADTSAVSGSFDSATDTTPLTVTDFRTIRLISLL